MSKQLCYCAAGEGFSVLFFFVSPLLSVDWVWGENFQSSQHFEAILQSESTLEVTFLFFFFFFNHP